MNYCGLDVAMKSSYLYITDQQGRKKTGLVTLARKLLATAYHVLPEETVYGAGRLCGRAA